MEVKKQGKKGGTKEGRNEGTKEGSNEGRKEGRRERRLQNLISYFINFCAVLYFVYQTSLLCYCAKLQLSVSVQLISPEF